MFIENESYSVKIELDDTYTINSADNPFSYDKVLYARDFVRKDFCKTLSVEIDNGSSVRKIALIGDYFSYDVGCAVLNGDVLTVLQNNDLTSIGLTDLAIVNQVKLPDNGTNFSIHRCKFGYLIYGEIQIFMLDNEFNVLWDFMGIDIFITQDGNNPFEFDDEKIVLRDWESNRYELDYNGTLLRCDRIK